MKYELRLIQNITDKYTGESLEEGDSLLTNDKSRADDLVNRKLAKLIREIPITPTDEEIKAAEEAEKKAKAEAEKKAKAEAKKSKNETSKKEDKIEESVKDDAIAAPAPTVVENDATVDSTEKSDITDDATVTN